MTRSKRKPKTPPKKPKNGRTCDRCDELFGFNRVTELYRYVFCGPCHRWVRDNVSQSRHEFPGIF